MSWMRLVPCLLCAALATACSGARTCETDQPYEAARAGTEVKAPEGLDELRAERRVDIPQASRERPERAEGDRCLDFPPVLRRGSDEEEKEEAE